MRGREIPSELCGLSRHLLRSLYLPTAPRHELNEILDRGPLFHMDDKTLHGLLSNPGSNLSYRYRQRCLRFATPF